MCRERIPVLSERLAFQPSDGGIAEGSSEPEGVAGAGPVVLRRRVMRLMSWFPSRFASVTLASSSSMHSTIACT